MKRDKKKEPKTNTDNYIVSSDAESVLYGLLFVLLGIIGLINSGPIGHFLTYIFVYLFGTFYSIFFVFLIFLGVYLIIKKKFFAIKIDLKVLGIIFLVYSFMIGASLETDLTIKNSFTYFSDIINSIQDSKFYISDFSLIPLTGGGIIGYFSVGLFNTMISYIGTQIVLLILIVLGMLLLFTGLFKKVFILTRTHIKNRKEIRKAANEEKERIKLEQKAIEKIVSDNKIKEESEDTSNNVNVNNEDVTLKREDNIKPASFFDDIEEDNTDLDKDDFSDIILPTQANNRLDKEVESTSFFKDEDFEEKSNDDLNINKFNFNNSTTKVFEENNNDTNTNVNKHYLYPPISLLSTIFDGDKTSLNMQVADEYVGRINELFNEFNIGASVISYTIGPSVTRFDVQRNNGVKLAQISGLQNELAQKLGGNETVRVELIVQGKTTSGIEVGNVHQTTVSFKECFQDLMLNTKDKLLIPLGKDISGKVVKTSIDELPHLLVAGTTGSGKSVFVHSIIMTLIMRNTPDELRLLLIDPKKVEFSKYHDLPHLLCPIISNNDEAVTALKRLVDEMERRYEVFAKYGNGANKYSEYIEYAKAHNLEIMPNIVMIVDEFADFISYNQKDVESSIQRIAQKARACGIYMILATQRPSVSVISGNIKANIPSRIALSVASSTDSRVIIDETGAETLIGKGDLLAKVPISKSLIRVQSCFVPSKDIIAVCDFIRSHSEVNYYKPFLDLKEKVNSFEGSAISSGRRTELDPLHEEVKQFVLETKIASTSKIQNTFSMGFSRADYILDCLEREGIVKRLSSGRRVVISNNNDDEEEF